jgi:hypothetical protein
MPYATLWANHMSSQVKAALAIVSTDNVASYGGSSSARIPVATRATSSALTTARAMPVPWFKRAAARFSVTPRHHGRTSSASRTNVGSRWRQGQRCATACPR